MIVRVKWDPAGSGKALRKAVGGFLRYVQYRDKHPNEERRPEVKRDSVKGLLKYVAYRDRAAVDGRLFGPAGPAGDVERREFAAFVADSIARTRPNIGPDGSDRRRAVYRFILSPERAEGLDLRVLTAAAMRRLECEGVGDLRWIAAEHHNTAHRHVHLVVAGMREDGHGAYRGWRLPKTRLAAVKEEMALQIALQRSLEVPEAEPAPATTALAAPVPMPVARAMRPRPHPLAKTLLDVTRRARPTADAARRRHLHFPAFLQLQAAAARYRQQIRQELEADLRRQEWEWSR